MTFSRAANALKSSRALAPAERVPHTTRHFFAGREGLTRTHVLSARWEAAWAEGLFCGISDETDWACVECCKGRLNVLQTCCCNCCSGSVVFDSTRRTAARGSCCRGTAGGGAHSCGVD